MKNKKISPSLAFFLSLLVLPPEVFASDICNVNFLPLKKETTAYFQKAIQNGTEIDPSKLQDIESKIAYLDAVLNMSKHGLDTIEQSITSYPKRRQELVNLINSFDFSNGVSKKKITDLNNAYFKLVVGDPYMPSFLSRGPNSLSVNEKLIHAFFTKKATEENLNSALRVFMTDAPPHVALKFLEKSKKIVKRSLNLTFFTLAHVLSLRPRIQIPDELIRKIISEGRIKSGPAIEDFFKSQSWRIGGRNLSPIQIQLMAQTMQRVVIGSTLIMSGWIAYKSYLGDTDLDDEKILQMEDELTQIVLLEELEAQERIKNPNFDEDIAKNPRKYELWKKMQLTAIKEMTALEKETFLANSKKDQFDIKQLEDSTAESDTMTVDDTPEGKREFIINSIIIERAMAIYDDLPEKVGNHTDVQLTITQQLQSFSNDQIDSLSSASDDKIKEILRSAISKSAKLNLNSTNLSTDSSSTEKVEQIKTNDALQKEGAPIRPRRTPRPLGSKFKELKDDPIE